MALAQEAMSKMFGGLPAVNHAIAARQAVHAEPVVTRAPYVLDEGEEVQGTCWESVRRFGGTSARIAFFDGKHTAAAFQDGSVSLHLVDTMNWSHTTLKLAELLKTARANYGESWGKCSD